MTAAVAFGVKETTTTTGTGTLTLSAVTGWVRFSEAFPVGTPVVYSILDSNGAPIEYGIGKTASSNTLERTQARITYASSTYDYSAPSKISLAAGTYTVICGGAVDATFIGSPSVDTVSASAPKYIASAHTSYNTVNTRTMTTDRLVYVPFLLTTAVEVDALMIRVTTLQAASKARCSLHRFTSAGYIGDAIDQTGDLDTTSTGIKVGTLSSTYRLNPGWYVCGVVSNAAIVLQAHPAGANADLTAGFTPFGFDTSGPPAAIADRYEALSGGWSVIPTTPNATTTGETFASTFAPRIWMRQV